MPFASFAGRPPAYTPPRLVARDYRLPSARVHIPAALPDDERDEIIARLNAQRAGDRMPTTTDSAGRLIVMCLGCGAALYQSNAHEPIVVAWQRKVTKDVIVGDTTSERWIIPALAEDGSHNCAPNIEEVTIRFTASRVGICCATCIGKYPSMRYIVPSRRATPSQRHMPVYDAKGRPALFVHRPAWGKY